MAKNREPKKKRHVTYNRKAFLSPNSIKSMSAMHTKIYDDGTAIIRMSDCYNSIKIWNDLNDPQEVKDMLEKIDNITILLQEFRKQVAIKDHTQLQ